MKQGFRNMKLTIWEAHGYSSISNQECPNKVRWWIFIRLWKILCLRIVKY